MNIKDNKLLHYVLIILLMIAPLRGVVATQCNMGDMGEMDISSASAVMLSSAILAHDMSAMLSTDSKISEMNEHGCCDDASVNCSGACDLGVNISLVLQETSFAAVYQNSINSVLISSKTLFRELTPPSRPPANLHS
ncbi:MAG: hypothetical protein GQ573_08770 [Gammaproteobacteria bacterium]|nr:hypothetical protein [Gammaproteobacteria bacterium]